MHVVAVDPRDQTWEVDLPRYRVAFHDRYGAACEYELWDCDVAEVLAWADANSGHRTFVVYACVSIDGLGLVRLLGHDPNAG